jgi:hypothetical protein
MRFGLGWIRDPSLHLIALSTALLGIALASQSRPWSWFSAAEIPHPPGCHACSVCPPGAAAARDEFLLRTESIAEADTRE